MTKRLWAGLVIGSVIATTLVYLGNLPLNLATYILGGMAAAYVATVIE